MVRAGDYEQIINYDWPYGCLKFQRLSKDFHATIFFHFSGLLISDSLSC